MLHDRLDGGINAIEKTLKGLVDKFGGEMMGITTINPGSTGTNYYAIFVLSVAQSQLGLESIKGHFIFLAIRFNS